LSARFRRTDMHLGVSAPRKGRPWGELGGSKSWVAHAPAVALPGCDSGADRGPAAQNAAGGSREAAAGKEMERW
jgi:hypothetical protein